ncbi:MAG: 4Fe-4S dicluster domain-containing protein [Deltaproteobacteria bacterium]|nr:4Fe-4S dicluster domain-containing protein [Deltaproteobacteria bacterium]
MTPGRELFWEIGEVWIFYVMAVLAVGLLLVGVAAYINVWLKSAPGNRTAFSRQALKETLLDTFLGRGAFRGDLSAGLMHLFIFLGFVILFMGTSLLAVHEYVHPYLKGKPYLFFEASMEAGGLILLAGLIWALVRRYLQRIPRLERRPEDALVPLWLLMVILSGFFLEGARLAAQKPSWAHWSFVGSLMAGLIAAKAAGPAYPYLWWGHAVLSLGFIALIPFTKLFHIIGGPAAFYLHHSAGEPSEISLSVEDGEEAADIGEVVFFDACMRCGRCAQVCPSAGAGEPFAPRDFVQAQRRALWQEHSPIGDVRFLNQEQPIDSQAAWYCTTCAACLEVCPVYGAAFKVVSKKRTLLIEEGKDVPDLMNQTLERLFNYENPWVASKRDRAAWAKGLDVPVLTRGGDEKPLCYFVGCTTSYDARAQEIAKAFTSILKQAGVPFGILGDKEPCCGDIARVVGEVGLFQEKKENCQELFDQYGIEEVVTSSPHCFHNFLNEYSGRQFGVRPYPLVIRELIAQGKLKLKKSVNLTVTYHDPCYLGRHNRIFEEPRGIIRSIPGLKLIEMTHHGADSLCCGGGGGRMWQGSELRGEARMSEIRIKEARATGAEVLITACPLCLIMLEDALKTVGLEGQLKVMDLNELVLQSLE